MQVKILDDKVKVYREMDLSATLLTELAVGNEVEIGKSAKKIIRIYLGLFIIC